MKREASGGGRHAGAADQGGSVTHRPLSARRARGRAGARIRRAELARACRPGRQTRRLAERSQSEEKVPATRNDSTSDSGDHAMRHIGVRAAAAVRRRDPQSSQSRSEGTPGLGPAAARVAVPGSHRADCGARHRPRRPDPARGDRRGAVVLPDRRRPNEEARRRIRRGAQPGTRRRRVRDGAAGDHDPRGCRRSSSRDFCAPSTTRTRRSAARPSTRWAPSRGVCCPKGSRRR